MQMDTSELFSSGIINGWEKIFEVFDGKLRYVNDRGIWCLIKAFLVITNERVIMVNKRGFFSKGYSVKLSIQLINILSVSIKGGLPSWLEIIGTNYGTTFFRCKDNKLLQEKLVAYKNRLFENLKTSGKTENPQDILRKRLARGEITLEEFHRYVQRL